MKQLKLFFALFAMLALGVGNAWAETVYFEGFEENHRTSGSNSYTATAKTYGDWTLTYADAVTSGSPLTGTAHVIMRVAKNTTNSPSLVSKALLSDNVSVTKVSWNCKGNAAQTLKVSYSTDGSNWVEKYSANLTNSKANKSFTLDNVPGPIYLKFVVSVASSTTSNRDANIDDITIEGTSSGSGTEEPALSSIAISGDLTDKTYEEGEELNFAGLTVTAKYDDNSEKNVTEDVEWSYTPALTKGLTSVEVTATYEEQTANKTIEGLTVNEHIITPGEYGLLLNNVFFGTTVGANVSSFPTSAKQDDITVTLNGSGTKTRTDAANVRMYNGNTLTFSVPVGYLITSIAFTEPTSSTQWGGQITVNSGDYDETNKSWSGLAQDVVFTFAAQNRIAKAIVTYIADVKSTLTIETPQNGTISVKNGTTEVTSGTQLSAGTSLVVTPTPASGYLFESLTVDGSEVELSEGKYTFTMPENDVTISATFKENEKPAATLTLSKNGETEDITGYKQDDKVTLPSITSDCVKEFVGWSANANCATEPEYKAGDEYTLVETAQTLYAVYATVGAGGEATAANTLSSNGWTNQSQHKSLQVDENVKAEITGTGLSNSGKYYTSGTNWRLYQNENPNLTISTTIGELKSITFTFTVENTGTFLYGGTKLTSGTAVEVSGTSATFTVGNSGTATNGQIRISKIEVVYTGGVTYSNYSTTCVAALDEPVFSVEGGENEAKTITLTATEGTIYYTLDGTTPTASSEKYTTPIVLDECGEHTIKAIAISSDSESPVASATYTIQLPIEKGTKASPLSVADVLAIYNGGCYNGTDEVYVTGTVSSASYNTTYSNYTVTLTDNSFQFYRLVDESNLVTTMQAGDVLIAKGKLGEYEGKCQLIECVLVDYKAYEGVKTDISNNVADPYTVEEAYALIDDVSSDLEKSNVYVKGIISKVDSYNSTYKSITYWISDDGTTTKQLQVYSGKGLNNTDFNSKNDLQVGDTVIVFGKLKKHETTYEFDYNNYIVSLQRLEQEETVAALPFTFTGSLSDIENTDGMKQSGLGSYSTSLKLKFDDTGDYLTIHFDGEPGRLRYGIKGNPSNNVMSCTYKVQTSVDGTTYTDLETYTTLANTEKTMSHALNSDVRYVKFIFAEKKSGNVALGNITISQPAIVIGDDDNSSVIATAVAAGNPVDVIVNRSFTANAGYYTLCVPFNMPASVIGTAYKLGTITKHVSGEGININLAAVSTIEAGVPYLIEPNQTVSELLVENVTIVNTEGSNYTVTGADVKVTFTGIINGGGQTNGSTEYYVGNGGYLYNGKVDKLGLRAFFTITDEAGNPTKVRARVVAGENVETGIEDIFSTDAPVKVIVNGQLIIIRDGVKYNVQGQVIK